MKLPKYVINRKGVNTLSIRIPVPKDIREAEGNEFSGKPHIVKSAQTDSPSKAHSYAMEVLGEMQARWADIRSGATGLDTLEQVAADLLAEWKRSDLEEFHSRLSYCDAQLRRYWEQDTLPASHIINSVVMHEGEAIWKIGVAGDTQQELRASLKAVVGAIDRVAQRVMNELTLQISGNVDALGRFIIGDSQRSEQQQGAAKACTFGEALELYYQIKEIRASSEKKGRAMLTAFAGGDLSAKMVDLATSEYAISYISALKQSDNAASTIGQKKQAVCAFLNFAVDHELIEKNRMAVIATPKVSKMPTKWAFTADEVRDVLLPFTHEVKSKHNAAMRFVLLTGCRTGEALGLDGECIIDLDGVKCVEFCGSSKPWGRFKSDNANRVVPLPHGGWCPKGRLSEDGAIPSKYNLLETSTKDYLQRTEANVIDSDAAIIFTYGMAKRGSFRTIQFARKHGKPYEHIDLLRVSRERAVKQIVRWLNGVGENDYEDYQATPPESCVLNVAGNRESKAPDIELLVQQILVDVIREVNPECSHFYPLG